MGKEAKGEKTKDKKRRDLFTESQIDTRGDLRWRELGNRGCVKGEFIMWNVERSKKKKGFHISNGKKEREKRNGISLN